MKRDHSASKAPEEERDWSGWAFRIGDQKSSLIIYHMVRRTVLGTLFPYLKVVSEGVVSLDRDGPVILAPVHRSHLDVVVVSALSQRRVRALAKESLFTTPGLGRACAVMGAIPVRRGTADLAAMKSAKSLLDRGATMVVFPEGTRQQGDQIGELFDGVAWLAARTGATVVPIGISGTEQAMAEGSKRIRRSGVGVFLGEPLAAPSGPDGKRANRVQLGEFTELLRVRLQLAQDGAVGLNPG